jgi:plastocyanin
MTGSVRRAGGHAVLVAVLVATAAVAAPVVSAAAGVDIAGNAFAPQSITIHVGDSVAWTNSDARSHTATADDGSFNTGTIHNGGTSTAVRFSVAGTVTYHCSIHPDMHGTIVVAAALPPTDVAAAAAAPTNPDDAPSGLPVLIAVLAFGLLVSLRRFRAATR